MRPLYTAVYALVIMPLISAGMYTAQTGQLHHALEASLLTQPASSPAQTVSAEDLYAEAEDAPRTAWDVAKTSIEKLDPLPPEQIDAETLWLARCIYSETKKPIEQQLVAWVVRNRVETRYRGKASYRDTVLDPYQFSAFNPDNRDRSYFLSLGKHSRAPGWQRALRIAHHVRSQSSFQRPFSIRTRHFFSERSMTGRRQPGWAEHHKPVPVNAEYNIDERRFRFYKDIS